MQRAKRVTNRWAGGGGGIPDGSSPQTEYLSIWHRLTRTLRAVANFAIMSMIFTHVRCGSLFQHVGPRPLSGPRVAAEARVTQKCPARTPWCNRGPARAPWRNRASGSARAPWCNRGPT